MNIGVCLTLAVMHLLVWLHARNELGHLLFTISAISAAFIALCEIYTMHAQTVETYRLVLKWGHLDIWLLLVSVVWFVKVYLRAGRTWLAWLVVGMRTWALILSYLSPYSLSYSTITSLQQIQFLGEPVSIAVGEPNKWVIVGQFASLLLVIFLVDAFWTVWQRGERLRILRLGGGIIFFILLATVHSGLIQWGVIHSPFLISFAFLGMVLAMAYELSRDVFRASYLARDLLVRETQLREGEIQMNLVSQSANLGLWVREMETGKVFATGKFRELLGFSDDESLTFETVLSRVHPDDQEPLKQTVQRAINERSLYDTQYRVVSNRGTERWISSMGQAQYDQNGKPTRTLGVSIDITQRRQAEREVQELRQELAHVDRVTMLGQLASALAHELSQPLGAILRNAEAAELFLKMEKPDIDEVLAIMVDIRKDDQRAGQVIDRMRSLMKRRVVELQTMEPGPLVEEVVALIRADAVTRRVTIRTQLLNDLPVVRGDRVQLQQVLLNLIINGMDAVNGKPDGERCVTVRVQRVGAGLLEMSVSDTGEGIATEKISKIFEPFFTTKKQGMGVGLAICRTIVEAHGGHIWAENNLGQGAVFHVCLPVPQIEAAAA
jgi:PAS domain S-box-containing protein